MFQETIIRIDLLTVV